MSLILKTDVKYTGAVRAKHFLELLVSPEEKKAALEKMLGDINADSSYVTVSNAASITSKLLAHIIRVQKEGATLLSLNYTLKAIIFTIKHGLVASNYIASSPDFGVKLGVDGKILYVASLSGIDTDRAVDWELGLGNYNGLNTVKKLTDAAGTGSIVTTGAIPISNGIINGSCIVSEPVHNTSATTVIRDVLGYVRAISATYQTTSNSVGSTVTLRVPTKSTGEVGVESTIKGNKPSNFVNKAGVVAKFEYGTTNNKLFVNNVEEIDGTSSIMADFSSYKVNFEALIRYEKQGIIEWWLINSKSDLIAKSLSQHLNRQ